MNALAVFYIPSLSCTISPQDALALAAALVRAAGIASGIDSQ